MGDLQDDDKINLLDLLQMVVDNLRLLKCDLAALGIRFTISPFFTAKPQFFPPDHQQCSATIL
jgi:hypothetical protein